MFLRNEYDRDTSGSTAQAGGDAPVSLLSVRRAELIDFTNPKNHCQSDRWHIRNQSPNSTARTSLPPHTLSRTTTVQFPVLAPLDPHTQGQTLYDGPNLDRRTSSITHKDHERLAVCSSWFTDEWLVASADNSYILDDHQLIKSFLQ